MLALLGRRVPVSLKVFLTALAIIDDLGAIVIIALFYGHDLSPLMLGLAALTMAALIALNRFGVTRLAVYAAARPAAVVLRAAIGRACHHRRRAVRAHDSVAAFAGPSRRRELGAASAGERAASLGVVPGAAGVRLRQRRRVASAGSASADLLHPVTLGCALGLFVGKQIGVFGGVWLAVRLGLARRPAGATWLQLYGMALLCGIGFTMSLFIGLLAFGDAGRIAGPDQDRRAGGLAALGAWPAGRCCGLARCRGVRSAAAKASLTIRVLIAA